MKCKTFLNNFHFGIRPIPLEKLKEKYCDQDSKFMTIDGLTVHYKDQGRGPALVLLHGVCASLHTWDGWYRELKDHYRIIRMDLPGWGITGPLKDEDYQGEKINDFMNKFFDKLGLKDVYLCGNSLGAYCSWYYTAYNPGRVKKLILLDPIAYNQSLPYVFALMKIPATRFLINNLGIPRLFIQDSVKKVYARRERITDATYDIYWELLQREGNRRTLTSVFKMIADLSKSKTVYLDVKKIKCPVFMAWGEHDVWSRWKENLHEWQRDLPHAKLVIYPEGGHVPMEEIPVETSRDAHNFLMEGAPKKGVTAKKRAASKRAESAKKQAAAKKKGTSKKSGMGGTGLK